MARSTAGIATLIGAAVSLAALAGMAHRRRQQARMSRNPAGLSEATLSEEERREALASFEWGSDRE